MGEVWERLRTSPPLSTENLLSLIDILVVAALVYWLLLIVRNARAWKIFMGILFYILVLFLSDVLGLNTLHWILDKATALGPVALVILLLPELRQALEGLGRFGVLPTRLSSMGGATSVRSIDAVVSSATEMAASRTGAIIVFQRQNGLDEIISNGVNVDARVSSPLLNSIFQKGSPLHDGAVVVRGDKIAAAACRLPLSENERLGSQYHMRHRAAVGMSEQTDAVVLVVSEERGQIALAVAGEIIVCHEPKDLYEALTAQLASLVETKASKKQAQEEAGVS